jgi:hypothetical protein
MKYRKQIELNLDKKYANIKKNVYLHLCYLFLMNYDY